MTLNSIVVRKPKFAIEMNRKLARKMKTYGRSAIVSSSRCIASSGGGLPPALGAEKIDCALKRRIHRPRRVAELGLRLRGIEKHFLARHLDLGQARARRLVRNGAR